MIGLDLLEIDRLEQALERRPRLAERLFTDAERAYAAARARPGAAPRGALLREGGGEPRRCALDVPGARARSRSSAAATGRRRSRCTARPRARAAELGVRVAGVADPHARRRAAARSRCCAVTPARTGSSRCPTPSAMRATDRWAIEERGIPGARADGARGRGPRRASSRELAPRRAGRGRLRQGQQRRRRLVAARLLREAGRDGRACSLIAPADELAGDAAREPRAPARRRRPSRSRAERARAGARAIVDALLGTGFERRAARRRRPRRSTRSTPAAAPVVACDVPSGVDASTGEVAGRGRARARDRDVPRRQARPVDQPRQGARRRASR